MSEDKINNYYFEKLKEQIENNKDKRIAFWGASLFLEEFFDKYDFSKYENIIGIIDINPEKNGQKIKNLTIFSPEKISELNAEKIILTIKNNSKERYKEVINYIESQKSNLTVENFFNTKTAERLIPEHYDSNIYDYLLFLKHQYAYILASKYINKEISVLEIGSGDGYGANLLSKTNASITALEIDEESVEIAKIRYNKPNIKFEIYDGYNINYPDHSFDVIISFQVIEHIDDVETYLKNIKKLLKPNGTFIVTTPSRTYRLTEGQKPWNKFHLKEYNAKALYNEASKVFTQLEIFSITAQKEILDIEFERVRPARADYNNEKNNIYLPEDFKSRYSIKDFYVTKENLDSGLDLLITNKKLDVIDSNLY